MNQLGSPLPAGAGLHSLSVAAAFKGRSVLCTGATGYVGSLCVEQLLRACPNLERYIVLHMHCCAALVCWYRQPLVTACKRMYRAP